MLILSRKRGEAIAIDSDIEIEVIEIRKGRVRLGIRAPRTRRIIRSEIIELELPTRPAAPTVPGGDHRAGSARPPSLPAVSKVTPCRLSGRG